MSTHVRAPRSGAGAAAAILLFAAMGPAACSDGSVPTAAPRSSSIPESPAFTANSGITQTVIGTATLGAFHEESNLDGYQIFLRSQDNTSVIMRTAVVAPGGFTGWHAHPGPVLILVKAGALTVYNASDRSCTPTVYRAGTAFFEGTRTHNVKNEGTVPAEYGVLFFTPAGANPRIEADFPPNCPP